MELPNNPPSPAAADHSFAAPAGMRRASFAAMGTTVEVFAPVGAGQPAQMVERLFAEWEAALSRFRPASELSRLNRRGGLTTLVSPLLGNVLATALRAARATHGVYDPALLPQMRQAGYDRSFELLPDDMPAAMAAPLPGGMWREIKYDAQRRTVYLPPGAQLDFGGVAKGMAVDAAIDLLRQAGVKSALVNAGGDLGVIGLPPGRDHWPVALPDGTVLALCGGALATSSSERRHWRQGNAARHHILDPRTGEPAQTGVLSVTVAAERCAQAEVAAKVAFILGFVAGCAFLERHNLAGALLTQQGALLTTHNWPHDPAREAI